MKIIRIILLAVALLFALEQSDIQKVQSDSSSQQTSNNKQIESTNQTWIFVTIAIAMVVAVVVVVHPVFTLD